MGIMRIKKYIANSMREALIQIKEELGEEAIILKTRKLPKKVFSLGAQEEIEVTAAVDEESAGAKQPFPPIKMTNPGVYGRPRPSNIIDTNRVDAPQVRPWMPPSAQSTSAKKDLLNKNVNKKERLTSDRDIKELIINKEASQAISDNDVGKEKEIVELKQNVSELKELVNTILKEKTVATSVNGFTGSWAVLYQKLIESEVKPDIAHKLIKEISSSDIMLAENQIEKKFVSALTGMFPVSGPLKLKKGSPVIVAFVGPTGAGKTTTLAKLAAHCCINKQKKVSIITADTYRIAAIEQIKMFTDIVKVGLQVVFSPDEIPEALEACKEDDIVFVDTAGRSQRHTEHMKELITFIEKLHPDEIHLVLSSTTKDSDLFDIVQRYKEVNINRLLFTKLDETVRIGNIFNIVNESRVPVSYLTFGQSVPDDIELAQSTRLVKRLWEGRNCE